MARPTISDNMNLLEELEEALFNVGHYRSKYSEAISKCYAEKSQIELDNLMQIGYKDVNPTTGDIDCKYITDSKKEELMQFTEVNSVDMNIIANQSKSLLKELKEVEEIIENIRESDRNNQQDNQVIK